MKPRQEDIDAAVECNERCVTEIVIWMKTNSLKLNDSKAEVIVFGSAQQLTIIKLQTLRAGDGLVSVTHSIRNLGVHFDAEMTMKSRVTVVCKSAIFHLRNISSIRRYLTAAATEQVTHAFVTSRLYVGNALLYRLPLKQIHRLQKVENWAVCFIECAIKYSHATPLLRTLHWLPIAVREEFKTLLLTHQALSGHAPGYIEQCVSRSQPVRSLRSSEHYLLCAPIAYSVPTASRWRHATLLLYHVTRHGRRPGAAVDVGRFLRLQQHQLAVHAGTLHVRDHTAAVHRHVRVLAGLLARHDVVGVDFAV